MGFRCSARGALHFLASLLALNLSSGAAGLHLRQKSSSSRTPGADEEADIWKAGNLLAGIEPDTPSSPTPSNAAHTAQLVALASKTARLSAGEADLWKAGDMLAAAAGDDCGHGVTPCPDADYTLEVNAADYEHLMADDGCGTENCLSHMQYLCNCHGTRVCKRDFPNGAGKVDTSPGQSFNEAGGHQLLCAALNHMADVNPIDHTSCHMYASDGNHDEMCAA